MHKPTLGKRVKPAIVIATGTSLLHGMAPDKTAQQAWHWMLQQDKPSHSGLIPTKPHGNNNGAPGLQQNSRFMQQSPACRIVIE
jgi:hypothetical protein